jgi:hypothetical protein
MPGEDAGICRAIDLDTGNLFHPRPIIQQAIILRSLPLGGKETAGLKLTLVTTRSQSKYLL